MYYITCIYIDVGVRERTYDKLGSILIVFPHSSICGDLLQTMYFYFVINYKHH